jgi:hypothetical protein
MNHFVDECFSPRIFLIEQNHGLDTHVVLQRDSVTTRKSCVRHKSDGGFGETICPEKSVESLIRGGRCHSAIRLPNPPLTVNDFLLLVPNNRE